MTLNAHWRVTLSISVPNFPVTVPSIRRPFRGRTLQVPLWSLPRAQQLLPHGWGDCAVGGSAGPIILSEGNYYVAGTGKEVRAMPKLLS